MSHINRFLVTTNQQPEIRCHVHKQTPLPHSSTQPLQHTVHCSVLFHATVCNKAPTPMSELLSAAGGSASGIWQSDLRSPHPPLAGNISLPPAPTSPLKPCQQKSGGSRHRAHTQTKEHQSNSPPKHPDHHHNSSRGNSSMNNDGIYGPQNTLKSSGHDICRLNFQGGHSAHPMLPCAMTANDRHRICLCPHGPQ